MNILVLGGDGYLGWPMSMCLSQIGHNVLAVDNLLRRRVCVKVGADPLFRVPDLGDRAALWEEKSGHRIEPPSAT